MVSITNEKIGKGHIEEKREEAGRTGTCKYRPKSFLMMYEAVEAPLLNHKKTRLLAKQPLPRFLGRNLHRI